MSDAELVRRAKGGDTRALDALVERYAARVGRLAAQLVDDIEDARDAAQESLLKLSERLRQFRGDAQFSTWLHRLTVNTCRDLVARQRLRRNQGVPQGYEERAGDDHDPSRLAQLADLRRELASGLARLSTEQRHVIVLRDALDLSYEEIADRIRMPVGPRSATRTVDASVCVRRSRSTRPDAAARPRGDRGGAAAPRAVPAARRGRRAVPGERVVARKHIRDDEWYLPGHFPGNPIMPGVLMVEALAQAGAVGVLSQPEHEGKLALFAGIDDLRFKRIVRPGDVLDLVCELEQVRGPIGRGRGRATVEGEPQCAAR